jgi:hypothetical protein
METNTSTASSAVFSTNPTEANSPQGTLVRSQLPALAKSSAPPKGEKLKRKHDNPNKDKKKVKNSPTMEMDTEYIDVVTPKKDSQPQTPLESLGIQNSTKDAKPETSEGNLQPQISTDLWTDIDAAIDNNAPKKEEDPNIFKINFKEPNFFFKILKQDPELSIVDYLDEIIVYGDVLIDASNITDDGNYIMAYIDVKEENEIEAIKKHKSELLEAIPAIPIHHRHETSRIQEAVTYCQATIVFARTNKYYNTTDETIVKDIVAGSKELKEKAEVVRSSIKRITFKGKGLVNISFHSEVAWAEFVAIRTHRAPKGYFHVMQHLAFASGPGVTQLWIGNVEKIQDASMITKGLNEKGIKAYTCGFARDKNGNNKGFGFVVINSKDKEKALDLKLPLAVVTKDGVVQVTVEFKATKSKR